MALKAASARAHTEPASVSSPPKTRLSESGAVLANIGSVGVIGIAGFALNLGLARAYGLAGLGVFSQALTLFLILGQACAGGFAFSTLHHFSTVGPASPGARSYLLAMAIPVASFGGIIATVLWLFADVIGSIFGSDSVTAILPSVGVATLLFGLNKVGGMALNGMGHLKAFAFTQALRLPLMLASLIVLVWQGAPLEDIGWIFVASEVILLGMVICLLIGFTPRTPLSFRKIITVVHTESHRGWRGFMIGLLADTNAKLDILVLSVFLSDRLVGIYAFGALFAEGLRMLVAAVQNVINPSLTGIVARRDQRGLDHIRRQLALLGRPALLLAAGLGALFMLMIAPDLMKVDDNRNSTLIFAVIALGTITAAPAIALNQIFSQSGAPLLQTSFYAALAVTNLILNLAMVPWLGMIGAALATAFVEVMQWVLLDRLLRRHLGLRLLGRTS